MLTKLVRGAPNQAIAKVHGCAIAGRTRTITGSPASIKWWNGERGAPDTARESETSQGVPVGSVHAAKP